MGSSYQSGIQTKQLILDVSKELFFSIGYSKTTYTDISNAAGMNRGLIPYHFKNKQSLGAAVCKDILSQAFYQVSELLDTPSLSDDLSAALELVLYYRLLNNNSFASLLLDIINDTNNDIFDKETEIELIKNLGKNFKKIDTDKAGLLYHLSSALKKEAVLCISDPECKFDADIFFELHIHTLMNYAGYSNKSISELTGPALQLADLLSYNINDKFSVIISYR